MGHTEHRKNVQPNRGIGVKRQAVLWFVPALVGLGLVCCTAANSGDAHGGQENPTPPVSTITKPVTSGSAVASSQTPVAPDFDQDSAWKMLVKQCDFGPRVPGTAAHVACRDYLLAELGKYTDNARLVGFTHFWSHNQKTVHMWNVIGEQNWKDAKVRVLLTAHWDSRPFSFVDETPTPPDRRYDASGQAREQYAPILGADDGASGIAVMLELAKEIKDKHPDVGIQYVLNDGEDLGPGDNEMYLGVTDYIKNQPTPKADYGILLDMIGNRGVHVPLDTYSYQNASTLPTLMKFFQNANAIGLGSTFPINDERSNVIDDNKTLTEGGVPTIDLIDFSYPYWHTLGDTVDKCSPDALGVIGKALKSWFTMKPYYSPKS